MNFNIVSPYDSAHNFTARFKEEVQIPKNSSVYLNYAKIERDRRIVLKDENTIELLFDYPLPMFVPGTPANKTMVNDATKRIIIPKGTYSATGLAEEINKRLQTLFNRATAVQNTLGMYNCGSLNIINFRETNDAVDEIVNNRGDSGILLSVIQNQLDSVFANAPLDENGLQPLNSYLNADFVKDANHSTNNITNGGDPSLGNCYTKQAEVGAANTYDNYAISDQPLQHYAIKTSGDNVVRTGANQSAFVSRDADLQTHLETCPRLWATTRRILDNINGAQAGGREFCGLYSQPYASGLPQVSPANLATMGFSVDAARTRGTGATNGANANPNVQDGVPCCYFGVEIGGRNGVDGNYKTLKVYGGAQRDPADGTYKAPIRQNSAIFPHGGAKIDRMILLSTIALDDLVDGSPLVSDDDVVSFAIVPYYKTQYLSGRNDAPTKSVYKGFVNRTKLYFSVCLKTTSSGWTEVYDTGAELHNEWYIFGTLLEGANQIFTNTQSKDLINMNVPFHPLLSSVSVNGGFSRVSYTPFARGSDAEPRVLVDRMRFKFSRELSSYIDSSKTEIALGGQSVVSEYTSHAIYPTLPHYGNDYFPILPDFEFRGGVGGDQAYAGLVALSDMYADTSDDAYVIYINNLPLKNYKNTRNARLVNETKAGYNKNILANIPLPYQTEYIVDNRLIGYYEPYLKNISDMRNQNFKTNYFDIEIRNALDDSPASYLRSAVLNFTIVDKKSKLIN